MVLAPPTFEALQVRGYQQEAADAPLAFYRQGKRKSVIGVPVGAGKTIIAGMIFLKFLFSTQYGLFLVPRIDLVEQTLLKFLRFFYRRDQIGIIQGDINEIGRHITIASEQTLRQPERLKQYLASLKGHKVDCIIVDECHIFEGYDLIANACLAPRGMLVGLSATTYRQDNQSLLKHFPDDLCFVEDIWQLVLRGWLPDITSFDVPVEMPDAMKAGHGISVEKEQRYRYEQILKDWLDKAPGLRTVFFGDSLADAYAFRNFLREQGYACETVSSKVSTTKREKIYDQLRSGELQFITNFGVMTTGNDIAEIGCVIIGRLSLVDNLGLWTQIVGRGMRLCPEIGKERLILLNCIGANHTLVMFQQLFGVTDTKVTSLRAVLQKKEKEEQEQEKEYEKQVMALDQRISARGVETDIFHGGGWSLHPIKKDYSRSFQHQGKIHQLVAERAFTGGYQPVHIDPDGNRTIISERFLSKLDAQRAAQQYSTELQQGAHHVIGRDPKLLQEPIDLGQLEYLKKRKVPMKPTGCAAAKDRMTAKDWDAVGREMTKGDFYAIADHLKLFGGAFTEEGGNIGFFGRQGVVRWGRRKKKEQQKGA